MPLTEIGNAEEGIGGGSQMVAMSTEVWGWPAVHRW